MGGPSSTCRVVPESPNLNNTSAETITVSNVMPLAGLFAVVAMALAATVEE